MQATSSAATLALSEDAEEIAHAEEAFWNLYWGPMALVEDKRVETAMINFGDGLEENQSRFALQDLSIAWLMHAGIR